MAASTLSSPTLVFFVNDTAPTEIYPLSLHDALPISGRALRPCPDLSPTLAPATAHPHTPGDRKSTRLNSSHGYISYAVSCLKKKKTNEFNTVRFIYIQGTVARWITAFV